MRNMDSMAMMSMLPTVGMTFLVIVPTLPEFGVGLIVGRGAHRRENLSLSQSAREKARGASVWLH